MFIVIMLTYLDLNFISILLDKPINLRAHVVTIPKNKLATVSIQ